MTEQKPDKLSNLKDLSGMVFLEVNYAGYRYSEIPE